MNLPSFSAVTSILCRQNLHRSDFSNKHTRIDQHLINILTKANRKDLIVGQIKPFFMRLCWMLTTLLCLSHSLVWNLDQLGYVGLQAKNAGKDRQRGPYSRVPERGSSLVWMPLVLSLSLPSTIFVPLLLCFHSGLLNKQEAKSPSWECKVFRLSVLMLFHQTDCGHNKLDRH